MGDAFDAGNRSVARQDARLMHDSLAPQVRPQDYRAPSTPTYTTPSAIPERARTLERPILDAVTSVAERVAADRSIPETQARQQAYIMKLEEQVEQDRERLREPARDLYASLEYRLNELHKDLRSPLWRGKEMEIAPYTIKATRTAVRITERGAKSERSITYRRASRIGDQPTISLREKEESDGLGGLYAFMLTSMAGMGGIAGFCAAGAAAALNGGALSSTWTWAITLSGSVATAAIAAYKSKSDCKKYLSHPPTTNVKSELEERPEETMRVMATVENTLDAVMHTINAAAGKRTEDELYRTQQVRQQARIVELQRQRTAAASVPARPDRTRV